MDPRPEKWRWGQAPDGLSVNDAESTSASCSVALHPTPERFTCVVELRLEQLSRALQLDVVAVYAPEEPDDPTSALHNPFHFVVMPETARIEDLKHRAKLFATDDWPKTLPQNAREAKELTARLETWHSVFPSGFEVDSAGTVQPLWQATVT
jgi:hypothetical protein